MCAGVAGLQLGIQNELTAFISLDGPELDAIPVNAEISFNWKFDGFGKQYCWIGRRQTAVTDQCAEAALTACLALTQAV
jgi:hypothetical protein